MLQLFSFVVFIFISCPISANDNSIFYQKLRKCAPKTVGLGRFPNISGSHYQGDCSGFVCFLFHASGLNLRKVYGKGRNGVTAIWNGMKQNGFILNHKKLQPGDIVFFDNTFDRNKNSKWDSILTHVGVVESVDCYGTITYLHYGSKGVSRAKMNLKYPHRFSCKISGKKYRYNDLLRRSNTKGIDPRCLSGSLYRGAARIVVQKK